MNKGFCYQENTHFSQAAACSREKFWGSVRDASNRWKIDSRREILDVVERHDAEGIGKWLKQTDYQKFLAKKRGLKKLAARQKFFEKSDEERLLAFAQELKDNLTAFIFSCREFDATETAKGTMFRHRRLADCHLNGLVMLDIDHVDNPLAVWQELQRCAELMGRTALVHITSSMKGIRIVFTARVEDGNLADNQIVFASKLGYRADQSCIDATRNSFTPKEEDILYMNETLLFDYYDEAFDRSYTELYREKKTQPLHHEFPAEDEAGDNLASDKHGLERTGLDGLSQSEGAPEVRESPCQSAADVKEVRDSPCQSAADVKEVRDSPCQSDADVKEVRESPCQSAADEKVVRDSPCQPAAKGELVWRGYGVQALIDARYAAKLPCAADSNRHTESLKLATDLLLMLDGDRQTVQRLVEAQPWVQEIIAERDENVGQTVASAADCVAQKERKYASSLPSKAMLEAIERATGRTYQEITKGQTAAAAAAALKEDDMARWLWDWGGQIEALGEAYPIIRDIVKGLKRNQYPAALFVAGGLLMTLMTRCTYRFYHRPEELRRLNNSTLIIGDPASGKSFATRLFKLLAAPIVTADKAGKDAINAYRELMRTKGANKEKPKKPKVVVRVHPARTSNAQFIQDMVNAVEVVDGQEMQLHMLTFDTELDNTVTVQKGGSWIDKFSMELKAFHNEEDGQAYSNLDSILQDFIVTWNFIYTGTPIALKKKVNEQNFGSGLATRLTCIPLPATDFEMMEREAHVDFESDGRLKAWAFKLDKTKGELPLGKIVDELYDWTARRMMDAKENDSRSDEMLLKRCAYHGLNFAAPFIVMRHWEAMHQEGGYWSGTFETDDVDWKLAELLTNIQYACQRHFFGGMAEAYFDNKQRDASVNLQRRQKTFESFARLPEEFTTDDVMRCFQLSGIASARVRVARLVKDHLAEKVEEFADNGTVKARYRKSGTLML